MRVRLWGTRGSVPTPTAGMARHGGNTPCVEVQADGDILILDAGTGLHWLGQELLRDHAEGRHAHLLLTHTHWAHIQGIPFFQPMLEGDWHFTVYGSPTDASLEELLLRQMAHAYCPVPNFFDDRIGAHLTITDIGEGAFDIGGTRITARLVNHVPGTACLGYRLDNGGSSLAYIPDVEYLEDSHRDPALELARGVDLLIHDAHVTAGEYDGSRGRGHSSDATAVDLAREAGAARLLLFHHHPDQDDGAIDDVVRGHRGSDLPVEAATERSEYVLGET